MISYPPSRDQPSLAVLRVILPRSYKPLEAGRSMDEKKALDSHTRRSAEKTQVRIGDHILLCSRIGVVEVDGEKRLTLEVLPHSFSVEQAEPMKADEKIPGRAERKAEHEVKMRKKKLVKV